MTKSWCLFAVFAVMTPVATAQHAVEVVEFIPSFNPDPDAPPNPDTDPAPGLTDPSVALGAPEIITGEVFNFPGEVSVFNPPFQADEIVSIGAGGSLTLRLSNFAIAGEGPELGFFTNTGIVAADFVNGIASDPISTFGVNDALVEVSEDGVNFVNLGLQTFDIPTNVFSDAANTVLADPTQPFEGSLEAFAGLSLSDPVDFDILELLDGSAGGLFLDISDTGLSQVGFVRLSVPLGGLNFELDAVSIASSAIGAPTIPEPSTFLMVLAATCFPRRRRRA